MRRVDPFVHALAVGFDPGELEGASVELADDLLGALARLADGGVDVVLLALDLPDGQGGDAVASIRELAPEVPVIAVAANGDGERAIDAGASDVVPSGAGPELLSRAIRYTTAIHRMEAELHRRQVVDELTGLYNARGFEQLASHHLAMADRSKRPVPLVFVRLDEPDAQDPESDAEPGARSIADTAELLRGAVRGSDVIARVGAGVFCILLTGDAAGADAAVLSRLVERVAAVNAGGSRQLSLSVGTATYDPERPVALDELIARADRRLHEIRGGA